MREMANLRDGKSECRFGIFCGERTRIDGRMPNCRRWKEKEKPARERERYFLCFGVNSLKILIYFLSLRFDHIIKRKGP